MLQQHKKYPEMYWVTFPDGYRDFFNKTWANEHLRRISRNDTEDEL